MSIADSEARALAIAGLNLKQRGKRAGNGPIKSGHVFRRELPGVGLFEIGIVPSGDGPYVTLVDQHIVLEDEQQIGSLMQALASLRNAVAFFAGGNTLGVASAPTDRLTIVQRLRGWLYDWERDPAW